MSLIPLHLAAVAPLTSQGPPARSELKGYVAVLRGEDTLEQADVLDRLGVKPVTDRHRGAGNVTVKGREGRRVGHAGPDAEEVDDEPGLRIARHRRELVKDRQVLVGITAVPLEIRNRRRILCRGRLLHRIMSSRRGGWMPTPAASQSAMDLGSEASHFGFDRH